MTFLNLRIFYLFFRNFSGGSEQPSPPAVLRRAPVPLLPDPGPGDGGHVPLPHPGHQGAVPQAGAGRQAGRHAQLQPEAALWNQM